MGGASDEPLSEKADEPKRKLVKTQRRHAPSAMGAAAASHGTRRRFLGKVPSLVEYYKVSTTAL